jgi:phosphatidylglycerol---prolipoprotein diacylglyceryl transferase
MLPVLFTITIPPSLGIVVWIALSAISGAWQVRSAKAAGEKNLPRTFATWTVGTAVVLYFAVRALGGQNILHLERPLAIPVHTYGILVAAGFLVAMTLAARGAERTGLNREKVLDLSFGILVAAMIGSRILFIIVNWDDYAHDLVGILQFWKGGLVFYGGFIAAALTAFWYLRRHGMRFLPYADTLIPSVAIGHFFGRLGCFAAGCCWGSAAHVDLPWLARFPPASLAYQALSQRPNAAELIAHDRLTTVALHPTQLYEALGELALFLVLALVVRARKRFDGQVLATWLMSYAVLRTVVELFRGDVERGVVAGLGVGQWTSLVIFAVGGAVWAFGRRQANAESARTALAA